MRKRRGSWLTKNTLQHSAALVAAALLAHGQAARADVTLGQDWTPVSNSNGYTYFDGFTDYADGAPTTLLGQVTRNGGNWLKFTNQNGQYWGQITGQGWANPGVLPPSVNANPRLEFDVDISETTWGRLFVNVDYGTGGGASGNQAGSLHYDLSGLTARNKDTLSAPANPFIEHVSIDLSAANLPRDADATFADLSVYLQPNFWGYWDPAGNGGAGAFVSQPYATQPYYIDNMRLTSDPLKVNGSWNVDADGDWLTGLTGSGTATWASGIPGNLAAVPNGAGHTANFFGVTNYDNNQNNIAAHTVTVSGPVTTGVINFNNANGYTISGPGAITLQGATGVAAAINTAAGNHVISTAVNLNSDTTVTVLNASNTLTLSNLQPSTSALTKAGPGALIVNNVRARALSVNAGSVKTISNGTDTGTSRVGALSVNTGGGASLDLANNSMVVDYTGGSPLGAIQALIASGYASGAWNGAGVKSSAAAANNAVPGAHPTALGYGEASVLGVTSFKGQGITGPAVLVRYTAAGDSNLDGSVDTVDFNNLAANFSQSGTNWTRGDFNYDGSTDSVDFNLLAANFSFSVPAGLPGVGALVPEPASVAFIAIGLIGFASRRTRRRTHN